MVVYFGKSENLSLAQYSIFWWDWTCKWSSKLAERWFTQTEFRVRFLYLRLWLIILFAKLILDWFLGVPKSKSLWFLVTTTEYTIKFTWLLWLAVSSQSIFKLKWRVLANIFCNFQSKTYQVARLRCVLLCIDQCTHPFLIILT